VTWHASAAPLRARLCPGIRLSGRGSGMPDPYCDIDVALRGRALARRGKQTAKYPENPAVRQVAISDADH